MLTTTNLGLKKPETTDARTALRTAISDNATTLDDKFKPISAVVTRATNQSIGALSSAAVQFTTEVSDTDGLATLGTNNDRLTVQHAGVYLLTAYGNGVAAITFAVDVDGTQLVDSSTNITSLSTIATLAAGAVIKLLAANSSGSAANVTKARLAVARLSV